MYAIDLGTDDLRSDDRDSAYEFIDADIPSEPNSTGNFPFWASIISPRFNAPMASLRSYLWAPKTQKTQAVPTQQTGFGYSAPLTKKTGTGFYQSYPLGQQYVEKNPVRATSPLEESFIASGPAFDVINQTISHRGKKVLSKTKGEWYGHSMETDAGQKILKEYFGEFADNRESHTARQTGASATMNPPVRAFYQYVPITVSDSSKKNLVVFIHGTFAHESQTFKNEMHQEFQYIFNFVKETAENKTHLPVDLISWSWNAYNNNEDRVQAGRNLAALLDAIENNYNSITLIAHSHGCNVVNIATHFVKKASIACAIYLACPVRHEALYTPLRIQTLYNFYSAVDKVQYFGSFDDSRSDYSLFDAATFGRSARVFNTNRSDMNIINIDVKYDGLSQGHTTMRRVLEGIYEIIETIQYEYAGCHELMANTISQGAGKRPLVVVVHQLNEKCQNGMHFSRAGRAAYKQRYGYDIEYIDPINAALSLK
jgi:predicted alpha/beta hydrolase family esterase